VDFDTTGLLLVICCTFIKYLKKKWEYSEAVYHLFVDFKEADDSVRREIYNIFIHFSIPMKLAIRMCLHEIYS